MEADFKRFIRDVRDIEREKYFNEHPRKLKKSYNVGIIGLGNVGRALANKIADLSKNKLTNCEISSITLVKAHPEERVVGQIPKTEAIKKEILNTIEPFVIPIKCYQLSNFDEEAADSLDVCFLTYRTKPGKRSRDQQTIDNIPLLRDEISQKFRKENDVTMIAVSDLTDTLAYADALYSERDSRKTIGMNHVGDKRFVSELLSNKIRDGSISGEIAEGDVNAYVWGCHDNPYPCFDKLEIKGIDISDKFSEREKAFLKKTVRNRGKIQVTSGVSTWRATSEACIDTLIAIMDEEREVVASTLYECEDGTGIYIGLPVKFKDGYAEILQEDWLEGVIESEEFRREVEDLKKRAKKAGLEELKPKLYKTDAFKQIISGCNDFLETNEKPLYERLNSLNQIQSEGREEKLNPNIERMMDQIEQLKKSEKKENVLLAKAMKHARRSEVIREYNAGNDLLDKSLYNKAIDAFKKSIKCYPTWDAYHNLGVALYKKGDSEAALIALRNALKSPPIDERMRGSDYDMTIRRIEVILVGRD